MYFSLPKPLKINPAAFFYTGLGILTIGLDPLMNAVWTPCCIRQWWWWYFVICCSPSFRQYYVLDVNKKPKLPKQSQLKITLSATAPLTAKRIWNTKLRKTSDGVIALVYTFRRNFQCLFGIIYLSEKYLCNFMLLKPILLIVKRYLLHVLHFWIWLSSKCVWTTKMIHQTPWWSLI